MTGVFRKGLPFSRSRSSVSSPKVDVYGGVEMGLFKEKDGLRRGKELRRYLYNATNVPERCRNWPYDLII